MQCNIVFESLVYIKPKSNFFSRLLRCIIIWFSVGDRLQNWLLEYVKDNSICKLWTASLCQQKEQPASAKPQYKLILHLLVYISDWFFFFFLLFLKFSLYHLLQKRVCTTPTFIWNAIWVRSSAIQPVFNVQTVLHLWQFSFIHKS